MDGADEEDVRECEKQEGERKEGRQPHLLPPSTTDSGRREKAKCEERERGDVEVEVKNQLDARAQGLDK